MVDYGGNISRSLSINGLAMKGLDVNGKIVEGNGTSYSTPRLAQKFASVYDEMVDKDLLLAKAMIIHSARMNSRELLEQDQDNIKYYGFGFLFLKGCYYQKSCQEGTRRTLLRRPVKLGTSFRGSCTRIFVILCLMVPVKREK